MAAAGHEADLARAPRLTHIDNNPPGSGPEGLPCDMKRSFLILGAAMPVLAIGMMMIGSLSFVCGLLFPLILVTMQIVSWRVHGYWTPQPVWHMSKALGFPYLRHISLTLEAALEPILTAPLSLFTLVVFPPLGIALTIWGYRIEDGILRAQEAGVTEVTGQGSLTS